jgi:hypothetical protein
MNFLTRSIIATSTAIAATLVMIPSVGWTKVEYDSNQLMMKNADQISELVRKKIKRAQQIQAKQETNDDAPFMAEPEAVEQLKDALRILLARPDQDGTRANAFARLRRELVDLNSLDAALESLAKEGISTLQDEKTKARLAGTYIVMLDNLMAEIKPEIGTNATFKKIVELIRDSNIKVSDETKNQVFMRSMAKPISPSDSAAKIMPKDKK